MVEILMSILEHRIELDQTFTVDLSVVRQRNLNVGHQAHSNRHEMLADDTVVTILHILKFNTARHERFRGSLLDYLIPERCITDLKASDLSIAVNSRDILLLNIKIDLDTATILEGLNRGLRTANYLQSVLHARGYQQLCGEDLQKREHLNSNHVGNDVHRQMGLRVRCAPRVSSQLVNARLLSNRLELGV